MKSPVKFRWYIFLSLLISSLTYSQVFNLEDYLLFVQSHQNMNTEELLQMHPAGNFVDKINLNPASVLYFDSISAKYDLTEYEKSLIADYGFMVTERLAEGSFGEILLDIHHNDLPVFVSTDAILYAFHSSYDRILRDVELGFLIEKVSTLLTTLRSQMPQLESQYTSQPQMVQMLRDV
ncbi:MAG: DUF3160 domain-containing protein, partial [Ignavibacteriaceae bacterium]|nr:DUF3160 domain-containing protein [Ignavibacteriaceae bacterium]